MSTQQNTFDVHPVQSFEVSETLDKRPETPAQPYHDERGKFAVGNPGGGRPKSKHLTEAYKQVLEQDGAEVYARVVADIALSGTKDSDRLAAVQEITDRTEGKAVASVIVGHTFDPASLDRLSTMLDKLNAPMLADDGDD